MFRGLARPGTCDSVCAAGTFSMIVVMSRRTNGGAIHTQHIDVFATSPSTGGAKLQFQLTVGRIRPIKVVIRWWDIHAPQVRGVPGLFSREAISPKIQPDKRCARKIPRPIPPFGGNALNTWHSDGRKSTAALLRGPFVPKGSRDGAEREESLRGFALGAIVAVTQG